MDHEHKSPQLLPREMLLEKALRLIGQQDYSIAELESRLIAKAEHSEDIAWVIAQLREARFVDDFGVASRKALAAREQRLFARRRVEQDLRSRKLDEAAIAQGLATAFEGVDENDLALRYLREKLTAFLSDNKLEQPKQLQRAYARMRRAGFAHAATVLALRQHCLLAASLDELAGDDPIEL